MEENFGKDIQLVTNGFASVPTNKLLLIKKNLEAMLRL